MARAARGRADGARRARARRRSSAARLRERDGRRVVALVGGGDNGGDALYAVAAPRRGGLAAAVGHRVGAPRTRRAGGGDRGRGRGRRARSATQADPRAVALVPEADVVLDGILGIGGRPGPAARGRGVGRRRARRRLVVAVDLPSGADPAGEVSAPATVFADETVTFGDGQAGAPAAGDGGRRSGVLTVVDIGVEPVDGRRPSSSGSTCDDVAAPVAGARTGRRQVLPRRARRRRRRRGLHRRAAAQRHRRRRRPAPGWSRYVGPPTPTGAVRAAVPEAVHGDGRVQAWVVGPGLDPGDDTAPGRAQRDAALEALASGDAVRRRRRRPRAARARAATRADPAHAARRRAGPAADPAGRGRSSAREVRPPRSQHARRLAELTGATVLLKGSTTLVVDPGPGAAGALAGRRAGLDGDRRVR